MLLASIGLVLCILAGCAPPSHVQSRPPRLPLTERPPVVIVPGISREVSRLIRGGYLGLFTGLTLRTDAEAVAGLGDPRFPAGGPDPLGLPKKIDAALRGQPVRGLQPLINHLVKEEGYVRANPDDPGDKNYPENPAVEQKDALRVGSLFVLYYDWRRDLPENACLLAARLARIRAATGAPRVVLAGHSLGGVLVRYYLRYGGWDAAAGRDCPLPEGAGGPDAPGSDYVERAVFIGSPHQGSSQAFRGLVDGVHVFGLGFGVKETIFSMPLAWEILPFAGPDGTLPLILTGTGEERVALFTLKTWLERGWLNGLAQYPERQRFAEAMLARAVAVHRSLAGSHPEEDEIPRLAIGADCHPTPNAAVATSGKKLLFLSRTDTAHPLYSKVTVPGDGVVTAESSLGLPASPTLTTIRVCAAHNDYLLDPTLLTRVVRFLLPQ